MFAGLGNGGVRMVSGPNLGVMWTWEVEPVGACFIVIIKSALLLYFKFQFVAKFSKNVHKTINFEATKSHMSHCPPKCFLLPLPLPPSSSYVAPSSIACGIKVAT